MNEIINIEMGDLYVGTTPAILTSSSIGSCVAVCLFSSAYKAGALAHIMLPKRHDTTQDITESDYKYADVAIAVMIRELEQMGIQRTHLVAKISGGANMFPGVQGRSHKVGESNIAAVKQLLADYVIPIASENIGGSNGREVAFDLSNGLVTIKVTI